MRLTSALLLIHAQQIGVMIMATIILVACLSTVIFHFIRKPAKRTVRADNYRTLKFERTRNEQAKLRSAVYW